MNLPRPGRPVPARLLSAALPIVLLSACSMPLPPAQPAKGPRDAAPPPPAPATAPQASPWVAWRCDDGRRPVTHYDEDSGDLRVDLDGSRYRLSRSRTASGAAWDGEAMQFWNQGVSARLTVGEASVRCEEDVVATGDLRAAVDGARFRALGNEPGWTLTIAPERMRWVSDYGNRVRIFPMPTRTEESGDLVRWRGADADGVLTVTITPQRCSDAAGATWPAAVTLVADSERLSGCGRALTPPAP